MPSGLEWVQHLVVLLHLIGFAALFGGVLVQVRSAAPEVNPAMLHGVGTQLLTGVALVVIDVLGPDPVNHVKVGVKLVVTLVIFVLVLANRRFSEIPRGLLALIGLGTLANAAVAVLWV